MAALLQYLFLSAFCWMMCEGIMLYLMLIVVFSKLSNKWWFFLILGYCESKFNPVHEGTLFWFIVCSMLLPSSNESEISGLLDG